MNNCERKNRVGLGAYPSAILSPVVNLAALGFRQLATDEIEQKAQAKNTKRATEWGVKKFDKWCEKRKITVDLKTVSLSRTVLSEILRKFFAEVKTEKGQALTPSVLTGIGAAIHRHLTCAPLSRNISFLQDSEFISANIMFETKAKLFTKQCETKTQIIIQSGDMQKLNRYFMEGQNQNGVWKNAEKLVEFIWFSLCFYFARRDGDGGTLQGSHLKQLMTLEPVTYVRFGLLY